MNLPATLDLKNLTVPLRYILVSHSSDRLFDYCPRKYEFLNLFDRRPARESGFAAMVGTALHDGTQAWLVARAEGFSEQEAVEKGFLALFKAYPWEFEQEQPTEVRSIHNTIAMQYEIIRSPEWDNWELVRVEGRGWAIEVPFVIKHTGIGAFQIKNTGEWAILATQGKIDFIMRHRVTGLYRTKDLKTTTTDVSLVPAEYTHSGQQVGYSQILHAMLGISPEQFGYDYVVARFSASSPPEVLHVPQEKVQESIDDYWQAKSDRLHRIKHYAETGWFPRTNGGCHTWGKICSCFDVCATRDYSIIRRWFDVIESEENQGYDWWVELEL